MKGEVKFFKRLQGWGIIVRPLEQGEQRVNNDEEATGKRDVFVHYQDINGRGYRSLTAGDIVNFDEEVNPDRKASDGGTAYIARNVSRQRS